MSLYAIGDLHLSFEANKPMDVFGGKWENYIEKLKSGFSSLNDEDICVLCGDISWAMTLEEAFSDFSFIEKLPGKKIILKGNHDYWWSSMSKMNAFLNINNFSSIHFLHNNCFFYGDNAICGSRGWFYDMEHGGVHDKKILDRECLRIETSLKASEDKDKYLFLHYPPKYADYECSEIIEILKKYSVKKCFSGHLHAESLRFAFNGMLNGTEFKCISADAVNFTPVKIIS